ncbi:MAG: hypothetical protein Q7S74_02810 [Nanoarchaeota archaeon]|nr:hypothetical protein [Nanoarchaeota archaeon]
MKKQYFVFGAVLFIMFLAVATLVSADEFDYARTLIQNKIPCNQLNESQLEQIGDYFMEQMHPGELHKVMEERLGGEGSESLRQAHINMGKIFYCGESGTMYSGMVNVMMGRSYGMIGGGMMNGRDNYPNTYNQLYQSRSIIFILINILFILLIIAVIIWIVKITRKNKK